MAYPCQSAAMVLITRIWRSTAAAVTDVTGHRQLSLAGQRMAQCSVLGNIAACAVATAARRPLAMQ